MHILRPHDGRQERVNLLIYSLRKRVANPSTLDHVSVRTPRRARTLAKRLTYKTLK